MKGAGTLALLILLAAAAGILIVASRPAAESSAPPAPSRPAGELYVEEAIGLPFTSSPPIAATSREVLVDEIGTMLDKQFGPGGLTRRTRAYELLGLVPPGSNLRSGMIAAESAGVRGWYNPRSGRILVPEDFRPDEPYDDVALHGLLARALLTQHAPMTIGTLEDDEWFARRSVYEAIAQSVEAAMRRANPEPFRVPSPHQTAREKTILKLPLFLHTLAQFPGPAGEASIFVESRVETGARGLAELVRDPPRSTFEILGGDPSAVAPPELPGLDQPLLEESVGALGVQTLIEYLDNFEQARTLALLWRGDRYRLYANEWGDNLVWICHWHSPEAAQRAREILARGREAPGVSTAEQRHRILVAEGTRTILADCASAESLTALREALSIPDSPPPSPP